MKQKFTKLFGLFLLIACQAVGISLQAASAIDKNPHCNVLTTTSCHLNNDKNLSGRHCLNGISKSGFLLGGGESAFRFYEDRSAAPNAIITFERKTHNII